MQVIRQFEVKIIIPEREQGAFTAGVTYPVLAVEKEPRGDEYQDLYLLIADDNGKLHWINWEHVTVSNK